MGRCADTGADHARHRAGRRGRGRCCGGRDRGSRQRVSSIAELAIQSTPAVVAGLWILRGADARSGLSGDVVCGANRHASAAGGGGARIRGSAGPRRCRRITVDEGCVESTVAAVQRAASGAADARWVVLAVDAAERAGAGGTGGNGNGPGAAKTGRRMAERARLPFWSRPWRRLMELGAAQRVRVLWTSDRAWIDKHLSDRSLVSADAEGAVVTGLIVPGRTTGPGEVPGGGGVGESRAVSSRRARAPEGRRLDATCAERAGPASNRPARRPCRPNRPCPVAGRGPP